MAGLTFTNRTASATATVRYLDLLDTVRTTRPEDHRLAKANLMIMCLKEEPVVLSQTQAFDSTVVLEAGHGTDGPDFRQLVADGLLIIKLLPGVRDLQQAFENALDRYINPPKGEILRRFIFSGWPIDDSALAEAVRAALRENRDHGLPDEVRERLDPLRRLSSFLSQYSLAEQTGAPGPSLAERLRRVSADLPDNEELRDLGVLLNVLVETELNERAALFRTISELPGPPPAKASLHDLVNLCYNDVVATSLGARPTMLAPGFEAIQAWASSEKGTAAPIAAVETGAYRALQPLSWRRLGETRAQVTRIQDPSDRQELISSVLAEELLPHDVVVRLVNVAGPVVPAGAAALGGLAGAALMPIAAPLGAALGAMTAVALSRPVGRRVRTFFERDRLTHVEIRLRGLRRES